ncbi:surfeit locus protein 6 homolog [Cylas formicarius]|uniref:surfeit locus protein 6 homolog n=1 Tax=Cylas formicarius TaxID=197179 RepID=UPI0029587A59|nr:surfeit locus protein 6 homolog [Cylas formicarius]
MQLPESKNKFDVKKVQQMLRNENKFITDLLAIAAIPNRGDFQQPELDQGIEQTFNSVNKKSRAKSLQELEERLKALTSRKKLSYKEKLVKKGLKNRMKKRNKQDERNSQSKLERAAKLSSEIGHIKTEEHPDNKLIFNSGDKIVFSKFDFANLGKKKSKKQEKDPKKILKQLTDEKITLNALEKSGDTTKVVAIKEHRAWKNALAKAEGQKIKDDPTLLKKTIKRKEQRVRSSKKKWEARIKGVENAKEERQKKRTENIQRRKKDKKVKNLKKAAKKGKIIPGF